MWKDFNESNGIDEKITNILTKELKFDKITKVQHEVIPRFSKNQDVIVKACTGSGKTLAYLIPLLQNLIRYFKEKQIQKNDEKSTYFTSNTLNDKEKEEEGKLNLEAIEEENNNYGVLGIILVPTRELAMQVYNLFLSFKSTLSEIEAVLLIGGRKIDLDLKKFSIFIPNIIIATPRRLCDIEKELKIKLNNLQMLILDEADKMLELGFKPEITYLFSKFNKQRRTGVFSATINSQIENIVLTGMRNPIYVDIKINSDKLEDNFISSLTNPEKSFITVIDDYSNQINKIKSISQEIPKQLDNYYFAFDKLTNKLPYLIHILRERLVENKKIMIFFSTCNSVEYFNQVLNTFLKNELIFKLHSKISQKKRNKEYISFSKATKGILLTTDLSSRGIDIPDLDLVIQYDPPKNEEVFVHRAGRTARVGKKGESILFLSNNHENQFIKYLKTKNIHLILHTSNQEQIIVDEINKQLREFNLSDKWFYDKAVKAFVSYVKFYSEHDLKYIFDINYLNIGDLANSFQLLRLPRIREILNKKIEGFEGSKDINPHELEYKDSNIRSQMKLKNEKIKKEQEVRKIKKEIAAIDVKHYKTKKDKRREKSKHNINDWNELAREDNLYKKFKQGKISKEEYDKIFMRLSK